MPQFRQPTSSRREPRPTAAHLVVGHSNANAAARGDLTLHIRPVASRDHRKRYHEGQRLAVRPRIGAATVCHVHVTEVRGPTFDPAPMRLADVTFDDARAAGHKTTLSLKRAWLVKHDAAWMHRQTIDAGGQFAAIDDITDDQIADRFEQQAHKPIWAVRFVVDLAGGDRFLAASSDELYVDTMARALKDEPPALRAAEFELHVAKREKLTTAQYIALEHAARDADLEAKTLGEQLDAALAHARRTGQTIPRDVRIIEQRLAALQRTVYRRAA